MKIAILYGTKYGATEKVVASIYKSLQNHDKDNNRSIDVELINLKEKDDINLDYDVLIIGSPVYMGRIRKEVKNFLKKYENTLIKKHFALFICGANEVEGIKQINKAFPQELLNHVIATAFLGGEFNFDKMKFLDKKVAQLITKGADKKFEIDNVAIDKFIQKIFNIQISE